MVMGGKGGDGRGKVGVEVGWWLEGKGESVKGGRFLCCRGEEG